MEKIQFVQLTEADIPELTMIMKRAFDRDTRIHLGEESGGPEGYDDGSFLRQWGLEDKNSQSFKIMMGEKMIGGLIVWINPSTNVNTLGTIFVDDALENAGIGTKIWKMVEEMYPETKIWRTETPGFSKRNHNFYVNKCGFQLVGIENPKDLRESSYLLLKEMNGVNKLELWRQ